MSAPYRPGDPAPGPPPWRPYGPSPHPVAPPFAGALPGPVQVQSVPDTPYAVAIVAVAPTVSGAALASLAAGIAATLVSLVTLCLAAIGADRGGLVIAGAFAILSVVAAVGALVLGRLGLRQVEASRVSGTGPTSGRGLAISGIVTGSVGLGTTVLIILAAIATSV